MIDVKQIRANPQAMKEAVLARGVDPSLADVDRWLELDTKRRQLQVEFDGLNAEKRQLAQLGRSDPEAARAKGQQLRERGRELEQELSGISEQEKRIMDWFPNWPHADMPRGAGEEDNVEERAWVPGGGYVDASVLGTGDSSAGSMPTRPHARR